MVRQKLNHNNKKFKTLKNKIKFKIFKLRKLLKKKQP